MKNIDKIRSPKIRSGQPSTQLSKSEFLERYRERFRDPNFSRVELALREVAEVAWQNYAHHRKAPISSAAGTGYVNPKYLLSDEWRATALRLKTAERRQRSARGKSRVLVVSASPRNVHTCPGESPKTFRLAEKVLHYLETRGCEVDLLDLSLITAEFGKNIYPCKSCVSTAMPLCHWPCSCYPNHSLGQTQDWMAEIYERWVLAHGVMILSPVHWYQAPSALKLMMDRLVCADGGNPDPTSTEGKTATLAKRIELAGWDYPKHLAGRIFSIVAHGDITGAEGVRRNLYDWLCDMHLLPAPDTGLVDGYIGYEKPYATSHDEMDDNDSFEKKTLNAAQVLLEAIRLNRKRRWPAGRSRATSGKPFKSRRRK